METWRFLMSVGIMIIVWSAVVTVISEPPSPRSIIVATVFASIGLFLSELFVQRLNSE